LACNLRCCRRRAARAHEAILPRPHRGTSVQHPNQFEVDEAWIAVQLNDQPIHTQQDGDFNFLALMDAASCFILASTLVAATQAEPTRREAKRLLKEGQVHEKRWPKTLFIPSGQGAQSMIAEAGRLGIG